MHVPKQTAEIFEILKKGHFICSNHPNERIRKLYDIIHEGNYDVLFEYFQAINLYLEEGDEFYYFSRQELKVDLERKIEAAFRWIDIVDFFRSFEQSFSSGYKFTPSDVLVRLNVDAVLKNKLDGLRRIGKGDSHKDRLNKIIKALCNDGFLALENEILDRYKVLSSFKYLEQLINTINIPEEVKNEIPE